MRVDKAFDSRFRWWQASAPRRDAPRRAAWESGLAKTDLGGKQVCPNCGAKFYDLRKRPAVCPKCTTSFDPAEESVRSRRGRSRVTANDPAYEDDDEVTDAKAKAGGDDEDEEESEDVGEVDTEAGAEPIVNEDGEEVVEPAGEDELPEGFSEDEGDLGEDAADDDSVPMIEDEEEFPEDEIGELPAGDDDDSR